MPSGAIAFADKLNGSIRIVDENGDISTLATVGGRRYSDGGCLLGQLALARDGRLLVAAPYCDVVLAVSLAGDVDRFAGGGSAVGRRAEGVPATRVSLNGPTGIAQGADGGVLILDRNALRRVDATGAIRTVAKADLADGALAIEPGGALLHGSGLVWRTDLVTGQTTIAAGAPFGTTGDGWATSAVLGRAGEVTATIGGGFVFADFGANRVRRVDAAGRIVTVAGTGSPGFGGDGGDAPNARIWGPDGVAHRPDGSIVFSDAGNDRLREVSSNGRIRTIAGSGHPRTGDDFWWPEAGVFPDCLDGCGDPDYSALMNYFYLTGLPLRAAADEAIKVRFVTTRRLRARVVVVQRGGEHVTHARATVPAGERSLRVSGVPRGRYSVRLSGRVAGRVFNDRARLRVR